MDQPELRVFTSATPRGEGGGSGGKDPEFRLEVDRAIHRIVDFQLPHEEWLKKQ